MTPDIFSRPALKVLRQPPPRQAIPAARYVKIPGIRSLWILFLLLLSFSAAPAQTQPKYRVQIKQIDRSALPKVTISFRVVDENNNSVSVKEKTEFRILENGELVATATSYPSNVYSVLVIDKSGSMKDKLKSEKATKIDETIKAANNYVKNAPDYFYTSLFTFNTESSATEFTKDKSLLLNKLKSIQPIGDTRLFDAIGAAIKLVKDKQGRKALIVITDGRERSSKNFTEKRGQEALIRLAKEAGVTISGIGIGDDLLEENLKPFESTNGRYIFTNFASEIDKLIKDMQTELTEEISVSYITTIKEPLGLEDVIRVEPSQPASPIGGTDETVQNCCVVPVLAYGSPNYNYFLYFFIGFLVLAALFPSLSFIFVSFKIFEFRRSCTRKLERDSQYNGQKSPNSPSAEDPFKPGDLVLICSLDKKAYSIRSWRYGRCKSQYYSGAANENWCYQYNFPVWLRRFLDKWSGQKETETGRRWLCNCAGDKEGY